MRIAAAQNPNGVVTLCDIYRGELLEGLEWDESEPIEWLQLQRAKLREAFISAVANRLEARESTADGVSVRTAARRLIEVDPYNEAAHRALMRLFGEEGEPARVREVYLGLQQRLREDLGVEPDLATTLLYRALLPTGAQSTISVPAKAEPLSVPASPTSALPVSAPGDFVRPQQGASGTPRITILPPVAQSGGDLRHRLASSLIEDVTIGLCRFKALSVIAPHTASELGAGGKKSLFKTFGIDYVVESKMLHGASGGLSLSVALLTAGSREMIWAEQYPFDHEHIDRNYRELSARIITALIDTVERVELSHYESEQSPTAYHLYLLGQKISRTLDLPSVRRARRAFKLSLGASQDYVPALSGLARTFQLEWLLMARGDRDLIADAQKLATRALEIDPEDARGHRELAVCQLYLGQFDESLDAFAKAEQRNPQHADLIVDFADALEHACEPARALEKIARAIELNPICPDNYWWAGGGANYHLERYSDAIECLSRMRDPSPAYRLMAASWAKLGDRRQARDYVKLAREIHPDFTVKGWLSIVPIRDPKFARHYEDGLREAGFD
jgi:tetratricopeptide (TPR) repeat protein